MKQDDTKDEPMTPDLLNRSLPPMLLALLMLLSGCTATPGTEVTVLSTSEAIRIADSLRLEAPLTAAEGVEVSLWASEYLMADPIGLDMDPEGRALVTITTRRRGSMFDIRRYPQWMIESLGWESVEERRAFLMREFATERSDSNRWLADLNEDGIHDWRDLTIQKEEIVRIEDSGGIGVADRSEVLIRDFHDPDSDVAGTVLWHEGDLLVGVAPDLWRFHEGSPAKKESLSHGYGVHIGFGGHGMSGLRLGPDGRVYWSVGDIGLSVVDGQGRRWHYPGQGAILRAEPDGSDFEVFASGLRNTHEFDFDKFGNLISVDNDGDHAGEYERLVHLIDGSDSGWRIHWQFGKYTDPGNNSYNVWMEEGYYKPHFDEQAVHLLPPLARYHAGPSGMVYNPGTALGEEWLDYFFVGEFTGTPARSGVNAFRLEPDGASFSLAEDRNLMRGVLVTSLRFGPDGALYMTDWVEGWATNNKGRIWRVDLQDGREHSGRRQTGEHLAASFEKSTDEELLSLMTHQDMRVRSKAQFELVSREKTELLYEVAEESGHRLQRIHALWGIGQISRQEPAVAGRAVGLIFDADPEIRAQAARLLGDARYTPAAGRLISLLEDDDVRVQLYATESLGRIGYQYAELPVVEMLERSAVGEPHLRHAGIVALARLGSASFLTGLHDHPSVDVRRVAVAALGRLGDPGAARFLSDSDERVVADAARAIHDDHFIQEALPDLAALLDRASLPGEVVTRRAIHAALRIGDKSNAERLTRLALQPDLEESIRIEALETISGWAGSSPLDRVTGRYRGEVSNPPAVAREALTPVLPALFSDRSAAVRRAAVTSASSLEVSGMERPLITLLGNDSSAAVRTAALEALAALSAEQADEAFRLAFRDRESVVRSAAIELIPELGLDGDHTGELLELLLAGGTAGEQQRAMELLVRIDAETARRILTGQIERLLSGTLPPSVELELLEAVHEIGGEELNFLLSKLEESQAGQSSAAQQTHLLYGGDAGRGREIFHMDSGAECIRCHAVSGQGGEAGPDLTGVGADLTRMELLQSLIEPSARITPGYGVVSLRMESGDVIQGVYEGETMTHLLLSQAGERVEVEKERVEEKHFAPSAMPSMGGLLSDRQLRDLVEYLSTLRD